MLNYIETRMNKLKITVYSDNICPFCYIGSKRLRKVQKELDFDIEWKPFEIHPDTPAAGIKMEDYFRNFNPTEMSRYLENFGKDTGVKINNSILANSHLSLRANEFAKKHCKFDEFHEAIYKAYFEEDKNIGDINVILETAEKIGLDKGILKAFLESNETEDIIKESSLEAMRKNITGVPTFIISNEVIVGAQPFEVLKESIEDKLMERKE
jgi:predicted DsbA family dithiol-disulfide isomerase